MVALYDAVCSGCGSACEVPFAPNPDKPVYCRSCYGSQRAPVAPRKVAPRQRAAAPVAPVRFDLDNASEADMAMVRAVLAAIVTWRAATAPAGDSIDAADAHDASW